MGTDIIHKHLQASNTHLIVLEVGGNTAVNTRDQATDTTGTQGDTNTNSNNAEVRDTNSNNRTNSAGETPESRQP